MRISITLMGSLKTKAPSNNSLDLPEGSTLRDAIGELAIDESRLQVVMLNGKPQSNRDVTLSTGDSLTMLPLVGGG